MNGKYQKGKATCKILRQIRQQIADENDIPLVTKECTYQGDCKGTCPKCEAELRYLEEQLARRQKLGKRVAVAAVATTLLAGIGAAFAPEIVAEYVLPDRTMGALVLTEQLDGEIEPESSACETTESETAPAETTAPYSWTDQELDWENSKTTGMLYVPSEDENI